MRDETAINEKVYTKLPDEDFGSKVRPVLQNVPAGVEEVDVVLVQHARDTECFHQRFVILLLASARWAPGAIRKRPHPARVLVALLVHATDSAAVTSTAVTTAIAATTRLVVGRVTTGRVRAGRAVHAPRSRLALAAHSAGAKAATFKARRAGVYHVLTVPGVH